MGNRVDKTATNPNFGREVELTINNKPYKVSADIPADTSLNVFIREHAHLKGTKFMCLEGGCGVCIVSVQSVHPKTQKIISYSVNSCLVPIFACHGWSVTTVEGLGSKAAGYHKIQKRLAAANGTQCGYCTPGMVMNMHSLLEDNPKLTMKDVENSFGGNICRCTGYRPILDAFKSLASDAPQDLVRKLADIEDMVCPTSGKTCPGKCASKCSSPQRAISLPKDSLNFELEDGAAWYRPLSVKEVTEIFDMIGEKTYRFIAGNTGQGVYRIKEAPQVYIDVSGIPELHGSEVKSDGITLGANIGLTEAMELFYKLSNEQTQNYAYCKTIADHIDLIANVPVRNIGTFAGNIALKHQNNEFPSDLFLILEMVGATLLIAEPSGEEKSMGLLEYLTVDMNKKIIVKINLPVFDNDYIIRSYKIMPRAQNAHAYVNAGFRFKVDRKNGYTITERPTVLFGGINPHFMHAVNTEEFLTGKKLLDDATLKGALEILESELKPDHVLPDATPEFRIGLAESLFYKFILSVDPMKLSQRNISGGWVLQRPVSSANQDFDTDRNLWPLNKPIPKVEALIQCSGEAEYTNDMPSFQGQVWGQLVLADQAGAVISNIDPSEALSLPGVIAFFSAKDIPGKNCFTPQSPLSEPVFVDGRTDFAGQAVGVIIADTHSNALKAVQKVKITYTDQKKVEIDVRKIINENMKERIKEYSNTAPSKEKKDVKYKIKGHWDLKAQYHYTMETQTCVVIPTEDHLEVYPAAQWPNSVQEAISVALNIPEHSIIIRMRRLGGGYGGKVTKANHVGVVCSLAAHLLHRPVRMVLKMETNIDWCGKRFPVYSDYEAGISESGEIQYLNTRLYQDDGYTPNDSVIGYTVHYVPNTYDASTWSIQGYGVKTDTPSNTWCRAPGSTEAISLIENVMEHISVVTKKDPISVRLANMNKDHPIIPMIDEIKKISDYDKRVEEIEQYNKDNRWKKRGISLVLMNYPIDFWGGFYGMVSIFGLDGTVSVCHGAIEMGQGINTKTAQVAAHILGIDLELVKVVPATTSVFPNNSPTGGSIASEVVCYAIKMCCEVLNERLAPIKKELGDKASWKEIINKAYRSNVNLNHSHRFTAKDDVKKYSVYGVVVTEVEVDILTGQYHTRRVDLIEDAGLSLSPDIDIGQVEGAFMMGIGYFTCEESVYDAESGAILTNRTWNYKPPGAKDIPIDFRVTLRKNAANPAGILRSKTAGEPPLCLSCSVSFAIKNALRSAQKDAGNTDEWIEINPPFTAEKIWLGGLTKKNMFTL